MTVCLVHAWVESENCYHCYVFRPLVVTMLARAGFIAFDDELGWFLRSGVSESHLKNADRL